MSEATSGIQYAQSDTPQPWTVGAGFIGLRLLGIYFFVQGLLTLGYGAQAILQRGIVGGGTQEMLSFLGIHGIAVLQGVVGGLLIAYASRLSARFFSVTTMPPASIDSQRVIALGTALIGIWTVVETLPWVIQVVMTLFADDFGPVTPRVVLARTQLAAYVLQVALGVFLFLRPGWVVGQFRKRSRV